MIIALGGCSSSGKTTTAKRLAAEFDALLIHQDHYYYPEDRLPLHKSGVKDWDSPAAIDFDRFIQAITEAKTQGKHIIVDGFLLYSHEKLAELFDIKILFHISITTLIHRRSQRVYPGGYSDPEGYMESVVYPSYLAYNSAKDLHIIDAECSFDELFNRAMAIINQFV